MKVKMNVQTTFQGNVLKKGEEYEVKKNVAKRWEDRNIAVLVDSKGNKDEDERLEELNITPSGSGWYELSNGEKVQGKEKAIEAAEALLENSSDKPIEEYTKEELLGYAFRHNIEVNEDDEEADIRTAIQEAEKEE